MEFLKSIFDFLGFTLSESKPVYITTAGGGVTSQATDPNGEFLLYVSPYIPLVAVTIAALKLALDFHKWRVEREQKAITKLGN